MMAREPAKQLQVQEKSSTGQPLVCSACANWMLKGLRPPLNAGETVTRRLGREWDKRNPPSWMQGLSGTRCASDDPSEHDGSGSRFGGMPVPRRLAALFLV